MVDTVVNRESESRSLLEEISGSEIWQFIKSQEFISRLVEVNSKTVETGREHGFSVVKNVGGEYKFLDVREGDATRLPDTDYRLRPLEYFVIELHTHPPVFELNPGYPAHIASPGDIAAMFLPQATNLGGGKVHTLPGPIGIVATYLEKEKSTLLSIYQPDETTVVNAISLYKKCEEYEIKFEREGLSDIERKDLGDLLYLTHRRTIDRVERKGIIYFDPFQESFYEEGAGWYGWRKAEMKPEDPDVLLKRFNVKVYESRV